MSVILYISGSEMQVVVGNGSGRKAKIKKCYVVPTPEGSVINGTVMDPDSFVPFIKSFFIGNKLSTKDVSLVINSSKIAGKQMDIPDMKKDKTLDYITREFADMDRDENDVVCAYTTLKGEQGAEVNRIYAENVTKGFLENYIGIFKDAGIKLKGIYSSEGVLIKLVEMTAAQIRRTFVVQIADGNLLSSVVWVSGQFFYYNSQRCFQNVGTAEYFEECSRTIDQISQFMKASQITVPMDTIYVGGMEKSNADYYIGRLNEGAGGTVVDVFDTGLGRGLPPGTDIQSVLMAVCGLMGREESGNLLKNYEKPAEKRDNVTKTRVVLVVLVFIAMITGLIVSIKLKYDAEKKLQALRDYNESPSMMVQLMDYEYYSQEVVRAESRRNALNRMGEAFLTYPALTTPIYRELEKTAKGYAEIEIQSFIADAGQTNFTVSAREVEDVNRFIADLMKSDAFMTVEYTGYSYDESDGIWDVHVSCVMQENVGRGEH